MRQILAVLLNKIYSKTNLILFFSLIFIGAHGATIYTIAKVNDKIITNIDLEYEKKILILLNKEMNTLDIKNLNNAALNGLINRKIKEIETDKTKIQIDEKILFENANDIFKKIDHRNKIDPNNALEKENYETIKKIIENNIKIELGWKKLIIIKFKNSIDININEIEYLVKEKNLNRKSKDNLIEIEKNKKLNSYENSYLNEIKNKYLIKIE